MAGQSEKNLKLRIDQVNGIINDSYTAMLSAQDMEDESAAKEEYAYWAGMYEKFTKVLVQLTRNYDEAVNIDKVTKQSSPRKNQKKTVLQELRG